MPVPRDHRSSRTSALATRGEVLIFGAHERTAALTSNAVPDQRGQRCLVLEGRSLIAGVPVEVLPPRPAMTPYAPAHHRRCRDRGGSVSRRCQGRAVDLRPCPDWIRPKSPLKTAFVTPVRRWRSELEYSPGVKPKYDCTACADGNRVTSSSAARNRAAVTGPSPGWSSRSASSRRPSRSREAARRLLEPAGSPAR